MKLYKKNLHPLENTKFLFANPIFKTLTSHSRRELGVRSQCFENEIREMIDKNLGKGSGVNV